MGAKGSRCDYRDMREKDLLRAYREALADAVPPFRKADVVRQAITRPASRFWVSSERAAWQMSRLERGLPLIDVTSPHLTEMYNEIYRRVKALRAKRPGLSLVEAVEEVVYSPAPRFYLTPGTAMVMICQAQRHARR